MIVMISTSEEKTMPLWERPFDIYGGGGGRLPTKQIFFLAYWRSKLLTQIMHFFYKSLARNQLFSTKYPKLTFSPIHLPPAR